MKVIAHRGFSGEYPENTMLAFEKALEAGADGIEMDIHLSKDGEVMIIHDEALMRTAGLPGVVSDYTRSELERISAGKTQKDSFGFTPIPSLEEYLSFMSQHKDKFTNIELKTAPQYYPGIEEKALALVKRFGLEENIIWSSFNWLSVVKLKRIAHKMEGGLLFSGMKLYDMASIIKDLGIEYFHPDYNDLTDEIVEGLHDGGVGLNVWTVNDEMDMAACSTWGINGLITNYPDRAIALLANE